MLFQARVENHNYEEGTFHVWDVDSWKKDAKDMKVEYAKLEDKSPVSPTLYFDEKFQHRFSIPFM